MWLKLQQPQAVQEALQACSQGARAARAHPRLSQ